MLVVPIRHNPTRRPLVQHRDLGRVAYCYHLLLDPTEIPHRQPQQKLKRAGKCHRGRSSLVVVGGVAPSGGSLSRPLPTHYG
jgi:hypothetical protein